MRQNVLTFVLKIEPSRRARLDELLAEMRADGSGLGLAIVVDLAGLYGGNLKFDSAPMGGLRAELSLPGVV